MLLEKQLGSYKYISSSSTVSRDKLDWSKEEEEEEEEEVEEEEEGSDAGEEESDGGEEEEDGDSEASVSDDDDDDDEDPEEAGGSSEIQTREDMKTGELVEYYQWSYTNTLSKICYISL